MVVLFFSVGVLCSVILGLWVYSKWKRSKTLPPGPSGLGTLFRHFICGRPLHEELSDLIPRFGELVTLVSWARPIIVLNNAYAIEQGLRGRGFTFTGRSSPTWMPGLKFRHSQIAIHELEGDAWRRLHSVLSRVLLKRQEDFAELVSASARPRTNTPLDLNAFCMEFSTRVFRTFFFGAALTDEDIINLDLTDIFAVEHSFVWHYLHNNQMVSNMRRTYRSKVNNLDMAVWSALQRVREEKRAGEGDIEDKSVLTALLEEELSDEEIIANLSTLLTFAATSSALQLQWCLLFFLKEKPDEMNEENCRAYVQEVLRLRPLLPLGLPRRVLHSTQLFGFHVPRDAVVLTNLAYANLDPSIWEDPNRFRADRFRELRSTATFGEGRRCCLGANFAQEFLFRAMHALAAQFHLKPMGQVTLKPKTCGLVQHPKSLLVNFLRKNEVSL